MLLSILNQMKLFMRCHLDMMLNEIVGMGNEKSLIHRYDPSKQLDQIKEWEVVDEKRRLIRQKEMQEKLKEELEKKARGETVDHLDSDDEQVDDDKYADNADAVGKL